MYVIITLHRESEIMDDSQILEILKRVEKDSRWLSENYEEIQSKYEGKIIAIKDSQIICEGNTMDEVLNKLEKKGENISFLLIESIPPKDVSFIL
ncbi:MAG: hypothetical protein B6U77_00585 [Candidatus Hecatellales archaeon ex4484_218]|nr:MAG: hypothetical protein B6U77_00585 [Candidatus Hecatellales archaeon ex4484_218]